LGGAEESSEHQPIYSKKLKIMETTRPVSKSRMILTWLMMAGVVIAISTFFFLHAHAGATPQDESEAPPVSSLFHAVFFLIFGVFILGWGVAIYIVAVSTCCFTFNYSRPVWDTLKTKKYIFNLFTGVALPLGFGFILSAFLAPMLGSLGLPPAQASILPVLGMIVGFQLMQLWLLIWSPMEKKLIIKRCGAMGITAAQLQGAMYVGISNPASGFVKRFGAIEEDVGALWVAPDRLVFRGDVEQFDLTHDQIAQIERRADNRSTTVLAGITHVVLHVRLPDGSIRQMRLHVEGQWTLGQKRRAMDTLAEAIEHWNQGVSVA
jgi:hypothetical protein